MQKANKTSGTKEWAKHNVNIFSGCSNDCRYCYARKMAIRFNRKTNENWKVMEPNEKALNRGYRKREGRIMFPTSHDITFETLGDNTMVLLKLLEAGNEVLIVTKPDFRCVKRICESLEKFKHLIEWRFTITSRFDSILQDWEPGAPSFMDRLNSLRYAYEKGFKTSISIEPCLDDSPKDLIHSLRWWVTGSIWLGCLNHCGYNKWNYKPTLESWYQEMKNDPIVRFKDALLNRIGRGKK